MGTLIVENLWKAYSGRAVIKGVNLRLEDGDFVCIYGPNGSGKSTLIHAIAGLTEYSGRVEVRGKIGVALQAPTMHPRLLLRENLELFSSLLGFRMEEALELCKTLGLDGHLEKRFSELSHGNKKKAEILLALLGEPDIILMDEPLVSLDYVSRVALLGLLRRMKGKKTFLVVTHFPELLRGLCDRTFKMEDGKLTEIT
ncbi:ATP-binding cassette domain-containing protein [Thermococcus sp.]|uniref:ATP-binding cassette domain-containing protein n=2 Tax=Thermococcus sp. TaxID=35749 RepID=UPI002602A7D7|nr:ABC transporter ATP-binding protein [Thermococcus sp.]